MEVTRVFGLPELQAMIRKEIGFGRLLRHVKINTLEKGTLTGEFTVIETMQNDRGILHGAFLSLLTANLTTYAMLSLPEITWRGVALDLHTRYFRKVPVGDTITVDAHTIRAGTRLVFTEVIYKNKATGKIVSNGSNTIYIAEYLRASKVHHMNQTVE